MIETLKKELTGLGEFKKTTGEKRKRYLEIKKEIKDFDNPSIDVSPGQEIIIPKSSAAITSSVGSVLNQLAKRLGDGAYRRLVYNIQDQKPDKPKAIEELRKIIPKISEGELKAHVFQSIIQLQSNNL